MSVGMARYASGKPLAALALASLGEILSPNTLCLSADEQLLSLKFLEEKIIEKKVNRARPYAYSFRVSADEKALIDSKVTASGLNRTDYLIRALSDKPIVSIESGNEILAELKRQGNNLNQAVKNNYFGDITEQELLSVVDECKTVYRKLSSAIGGR